MRFVRNNTATTQLIPLHGEDWFQRQSVAGKAVAECLATCKKWVETQEGQTLKDLEAKCLEILKKYECTPTFQGYHGFPGAICTSVNRNMVHGIPTNYQIKKGDVVKVDLGATYQGAIADAAITAVCLEAKKAEHRELVNTCKKALDEAIKSVEPGKNLGCIGNAIHHATKSTQFKLVTDYGGHGIAEDKVHAEPFVPNKARAEEGITIQPGMALAIEPMLVAGLSSKTKTLKDGWTVRAKDVSVHWEHSIWVGQDRVHIMTDWESFIS